MLRVAISAILAALAAAHVSLAASPDVTTVRSADHPGFGRIVVNAVSEPTYKIEQAGDHFLIHFADPTSLGAAPPAPRNVVNLATNGATADIVVVPGATLRPELVPHGIVFDILDPPQATASVSSASTRKPSKPLAARPVQTVMTRSPELGGRSASRSAPPSHQPETPPVAQSAAPAATRTAAPAAQATVVPQSPSPPPPTANLADSRVAEATKHASPARDLVPQTARPQAIAPETVASETTGSVGSRTSGPVGLLALRAKLPKGLDGSAFTVPFANTTGAAVFQRSGGTFAVFDERRPIDMAALRNDPIFGKAVVQMLPTGTLLRLPIPPGMSIALSQTPQGWRVAALNALPKLQPIAAAFTDKGLSLGAEQPGEVISMADPDTGATLLIGTQRRPGQGIANSRRSTEFILPVTRQGVVVEPLSDAIELRTAPTGFILTGGAGGLATSPPTPVTDALMDAAHLTRRLSFATVAPDTLMRRLSKQLAEAAAAPPQARGSRRRAAAESMMALGLGAEAESLLHLAADQDPREAASADAVGLTAIAALLAGRPAEADGLDDPRLAGTDDIAFWQAVRQAMQDEGSPSAAAVFANTAPLVSLYPQPIRDRVLPLMAETMIQGGEIGPARQLLAQHKRDSGLGYARALQSQAEGDTDQALASLDLLAAGHDQFDRARAAARAVELRLSARKIDNAQAADALDKLLFAWRGDQRELALRERIAELRGLSGDWRSALATLRQAESDFPEQLAAIHERLKDAFAAMVGGRGLDQMAPIDFVSAVADNADLMPGNGGEEEALDERLADRLLALDLPDRAKPVLEKLLKSASTDTGKARFGAGLAELYGREKDDAAALATLDASQGRDLPPELVEKRALLRAAAVARQGDPAGAAASLAKIGTPATNEARAQILEQAQDWPGAERAWSDFASAALPQAGGLDDSQVRTLLRLTTAAARAGDDGALAALRVKYDSRIGAGAFANMFRLLTTQPIRGTGDLKRARQDVSLAQSLPANLKALEGSPPQH